MLRVVVVPQEAANRVTRCEMTSSEKNVSAILRQASEKLEGTGGSLDDLPSDRDSPDWNVWSEQVDLQPLELQALKSRKERQQQQQYPGWGRPTLPPQMSGQNDTPLLEQIFQSLVLPTRKAACRMWTGDPTVYKLKATSFQVFDKAVRAKYAHLEEDRISYFFIKNKRKVDSRTYISNDAELEDFFDLAGKPTIYIWPCGSPSLSPDSLPSQVEVLHLSTSAESLSESSGSSRGHAQTLFRNAVRKRDNNKCVLSGEELRPKAGNVEAAHIFGIEASLDSQREVAGVVNPYDTWNGMLLEKSLHVAFNAYLWCMDECCKVHVSEDGKKKGMGKWEGKTVTLSVDSSPTFPSTALLKARFVLYKEKQKKKKSGH